VVGRFLQPDSIVPEPGNPQALNRYAYTLNNPVLFTDPSGHCIPGLNCPNDYIIGNEDPIFGGQDFLSSNPIEPYDGSNPYDWIGGGTASQGLSQVSEEYDVPPEVLAAILQMENNPRLGIIGVLRRGLKMNVNQILQMLDPQHDFGLGYSRGIGNVKPGTATSTAAYFGENYPGSEMAGYVDASTMGIWNSLDLPQGNIEFVAGYARQAIDEIYGQGYNGPMSAEGLSLVMNHHNTGRTDHAALQWGYGNVARSLMVHASEGTLPLVFFR
jgi:hypothetical protein